LAKGRVEGRAEGRSEGLAEGFRQVLLKILRRRFGDLSESTHARVQTADPETLKRWLDRALDSAVIDDVFMG
jgi:flagellar biosynthesis/type III secretory pathway protein FliH